MDGQSLPTDSARAEDDCPATRLSIQTDRRDDQSAKPECCAVGLGLMADLDGRIERVGRGAGHNRSVIEQHRCRAAAIVFVETVADQRPACIHRRREIGLVHEVDLTDTTRGGQRSVAPMSRGRRERDPGPLCRPEVPSSQSHSCFRRCRACLCFGDRAQFRVRRLLATDEQAPTCSASCVRSPLR